MNITNSSVAKTLRYFFIMMICLMVVLIVPKSKAQNKQQKDTIKIGLLVSDKKYSQAQKGAELAVIKAAVSNLMNGKTVEVLTRSMEGPWGTGAKQTVDLVFNHNVWAIVGSHDGRNAHLAEQVIAKTQVVYISAWSGDPTLAQAYVPWFYSMVPNNIQQAKSLYSELYSQSNPGRVVVVTDDTYDAGNALKFFLKELEEHSEGDPAKISYQIRDFHAERIVSQIQELNPEVLVLFSRSQESVSLIKTLRESSANMKIVATFESLGETPGKNFDIADYKGASIPGLIYLNSESGIDFIKSYKSEFNENVSPTAAYTYDAVWLLLNKIKECGYNRETFKTFMQDTNENGLTGIIQFDSIGNRKQKMSWIQIK